MKKTLLLKIAFMLFLFHQNINAQVNTTFFDKSDSFSATTLMLSQDRSVVLKKIPEFDIQKLLIEDKEKAGMDQPFRFGYDVDVNYTMEDGRWEILGSKRTWSMHVYSKEAYSLNFIFEEMHLSPDAELFIYNPDASMVYGPVTAKQNTESGIFWTDLIAGENAIIKLIEPISSQERSTLKISKVVHGYKDTFLDMNTKAASNCHINVVCSLQWQVESNAVALVLLANGTAWGSGALINNTEYDDTPYFLTAFHCLDTNRDNILTTTERNAVNNLVYRFKYRTASCNGNTSGTYTSYNGAYFRAAWNRTDFALLELRNRNITNDSSISYLGWDRRIRLFTCLLPEPGIRCTVRWFPSYGRRA